MLIEELYALFIKHPDVSIDSRNIRKNCLFFALKGERFDGNQFAKKAIEDGAAYAIVDDKTFATDTRCILVNDTLKTLQLLANYHRKKLNIPILAITGTNGKTTTKELVASVLKQKYNTVFTQGNLNNHIGVPLTLLSMNANTEFGVVEMGANHQFEIKALCEIAEPTYGLITNIGKAHLEGFGSFENIIKTKCELYDFLTIHGGTIFYNAENNILKKKLETLDVKKIPYGTSKELKVNGNVNNARPFLSVELNQNENKYIVSTNLIGSYNLENIVAAVCVGDYFGVKSDHIKRAIEEYIPSNNRSQLIKSKDNAIYLDAYNANPTSIRASLQNFIELDIENKCLILGDMLELGSEAEKEHINILRFIEESEFQKVILVGEIFSKLITPENYIKFSNVSQVKLWLEKNKIHNSNVLVKGSRGIKLEQIVNYL
ncbi:MAG: UDP-N-acetylmuramoyl-tripeptide--D-alanyl-D-alanine ligase [Bacteroidales bacterium]|jgi:UDP-N-acetylmuramoyl-tripeptide--D-alanyl-D-alanine ligase|nr:UDP-N-acetylmuramoyl-tripeptide--D-alanyl-D-alanine ligase [Bacteroidales bacterium]